MYKSISRAQIKLIRSLRLLKYRKRTHSFLVEGAKNVRALLNSSYRVSLLLVTPKFYDTLDAQHYSVVDTVIPTDRTTLNALGTLSNNDAALAVVLMPPHTHTAPLRATWGLVLDGIQDPGNMGTLLRIADWFNLPALVCSIDTVDVYNPKVIQASMGSFINLPVYYVHLPTWLRETTLPVWGASTRGLNMRDVQIPLPGLLVIGSEAHGIRPAINPYLQQEVRIPRYGHAESLNAAVAAGILCNHWINF